MATRPEMHIMLEEPARCKRVPRGALNERFTMKCFMGESSKGGQAGVVDRGGAALSFKGRRLAQGVPSLR